MRTCSRAIFASAKIAGIEILDASKHVNLEGLLPTHYQVNPALPNGNRSAADHTGLNGFRVKSSRFPCFNPFNPRNPWLISHWMLRALGYFPAPPATHGYRNATIEPAK
jgi:hypothetical protein